MIEGINVNQIKEMFVEAGMVNFLNEIVRDSKILHEYIKVNFPEEYKKFNAGDSTLIITALDIIKKLNKKKDVL